MMETNLKDIPAKRLAEMWCELNRFEWPDDLGPKPEGYGERDDDKSGWAMMCEIQAIIDIKECLREWNKNRMDNDTFEEWWSNRK